MRVRSVGDQVSALGGADRRDREGRRAAGIGMGMEMDGLHWMSTLLDDCWHLSAVTELTQLPVSSCKPVQLNAVD